MLTLWMLVGATWIAHGALLFVPGDAAFSLLMGRAPAPVWLALAGAFLPQAVLIPWAWRDTGRRLTAGTRRRLWRLAFFLTGFAAVTVYLLLLRRRSAH